MTAYVCGTCRALSIRPKGWPYPAFEHRQVQQSFPLAARVRVAQSLHLQFVIESNRPLQA